MSPAWQLPLNVQAIPHKELVVLAKRWLLGTAKCGFALTEFRNYATETPDAIGWRRDQSHMIECISTKSAFHYDLHSKEHWKSCKLFRIHSELGMGNFRYYMSSPNLIQEKHLPDKWGLLWVYGNGIKVVKQPELFGEPCIAENDRRLLCAALKRLCKGNKNGK